MVAINPFVGGLFFGDQTATLEHRLEKFGEDAPPPEQIRLTIETSFQPGIEYTPAQVEFAAKHGVKKDIRDEMIGGVVLKRISDSGYLFQSAMDVITRYNPNKDVIRKSAQTAVNRVAQELDNMLQSGGVSNCIYEKQHTNTERNLSALMAHYKWAESEIDTTRLRETFERVEAYLSERDRLFEQQTSFSYLPWYGKVLTIGAFVVTPLIAGVYELARGTNHFIGGRIAEGTLDYAFALLVGVAFYSVLQRAGEGIQNKRVDYYLLDLLPNDKK